MGNLNTFIPNAVNYLLRWPIQLTTVKLTGQPLTARSD